MVDVEKNGLSLDPSAVTVRDKPHHSEVPEEETEERAKEQQSMGEMRMQRRRWSLEE